ncbi:MAG TPA: universal stress protein [Actinomycetes bacterium]|nr:universal stress protein [Actinomycetes bacterium]
MTRQEPGVVVGVDGSEPSLAALNWAIAEAVDRQARLRVVHTYSWPMYREGFDALPPGPEEGGLRTAAVEILAKAVQRVRATAPELPVDSVLHTGPTSRRLLAEAADADLLVVGSRGHGGFAGLLLGSVSGQVATHAPCPVVVVRSASGGAGPWTGRVIVGVEDIDGSAGMVEFAMDEAARLGTGLVVAHCMPPALTVSAMPGPAVLYDDTELVESAELRFAEAVARWADKRPELSVTAHFCRRPPAWMLIEASAGAKLVVVGSRGRGGFTGLLLGSVSRQLLHHAACPVAVIPVRATVE